MPASPERLHVRAGTSLFDEGDPGSVAYLIERGRVGLFVTDRDQRRPAGERGPGDLAGELAIVEEGPRHTGAVALTDCELLVITREQIARRFEDIDPLLRVCLGAIVSHCRAAARQRSADDRAAEIGAEWHDATNARGILSLERQLRHAIRAGQMVLHFQPIVRLDSRRIAGFEALLRWQHPERGLLMPGDFVPLAESSDIIRDITTWCLTAASAQFPALMAASAGPDGAGPPPFLSVNISAADLHEPGFADRAAGLVRAAGVDPRHIRLEVTESVLIRETETCARTLAECRARGMQIAIDDFGSGYSALNYLNLFPVSILKVDRSFARALLTGQQGPKIMEAILHLGRDLGLTAIVEGIESEAEATLLGRMGCELGQGYLFGRGQPLARTLDLVRTSRQPHAVAPLRARRA